MAKGDYCGWKVWVREKRKRNLRVLCTVSVNEYAKRVYWLENSRLLLNTYGMTHRNVNNWSLQEFRQSSHSTCKAMTPQSLRRL